MEGHPVSDEARATERPATFREVFASGEFRAVFTAFGLSWFGDYLAKAAVTALVYARTESVGLSAATFALSFLPWIIGGPLLSTLADRHRYRTVMIVCDLLRMATIALVAVPNMPVQGMLVLLFLTSLANPPAQAAKSALMPLMLSRDRLVVGLALNSSSGQAAQVGGYVAGAAMAPFYPELALLVDAATFGLSALLIRLGVRDRPPASSAAERRHLLRETGEGFRLVFGTPVLRSIAVMVYAAMLFSIVPEGLAAAWAADVSTNDTEQGLSQGLIMAANPIGFILGGLLISRLVGPSRRQSLVRPFAVLAPASLVPALLHPPAVGVALMAAVCGFAIAGMMPTANGLFVQALPHGFRARAFGVMQSGVQVMQGIAVIGTGLLADFFDLPDVVGIWSLAGVGLMLLVSAWWPSPNRFAQAISAASRASAAADAAASRAAAADPTGRHRGRDEPPGPPGGGGPSPNGPGPHGGPHDAVEPPRPAAPAGRPPWPDAADVHEHAAPAGRHNATGAHRAGSRRGAAGHGGREEAQAGGAGRNTGPRATDDPAGWPTSPPKGATTTS
jgi:MFS family permease